MNKISEEHDFILKLLTRRNNIITKEQLKEVNWNKILKLGTWHRINPIIYRRLKSQNLLESLPVSIANKFRDIYQYNLARNIVLIKELSAINGSFGEKGIHFLLIKGLSLSGDVYDDSAERITGDLDLLVNVMDLRNAEKILVSLGYRVKETRDEDLKNHYHITYINHDKKLTVELHFLLLNQSHFMNNSFMHSGFTQDMIRDKRIIKIFGISVNTLNIEEQLVYLSLHFVKHRSLEESVSSLGALMQLNDIYLTLNKYDQADWDKITRLSDNYNVSQYVSLTLRLVAYYFDEGNNNLGIPGRFIKHSDTEYDFDTLKMNLLLIDRVKYRIRIKDAIRSILKKFKLYSLLRIVFHSLQKQKSK